MAYFTNLEIYLCHCTFGSIYLWSEHNLYCPAFGELLAKMFSTSTLILYKVVR